MALNLDTRCTEHFASELAKGLADANVQYGRFIDPSWMWVGERIARILPQTPKSRAAAGLAEISNLTVSFFLLDQVKEMLTSNPGTTEETPTKLSDIAGFADLVAVAGELTERLLTLPWYYEVLFKTPLTAAHAHELPLSSRYFLKSFGETDVPEFPLHPVDGMAQHMFRQRFPEALSTEQYYLGGRFTGYLHTVEPIPELEELLDVAKGALGLALVANVLKLETLRYNTSVYTVPFIVYRIMQGERRLLPYVCFRRRRRRFCDGSLAQTVHGRRTSQQLSPQFKQRFRMRRLEVLRAGISTVLLERMGFFKSFSQRWLSRYS